MYVKYTNWEVEIFNLKRRILLTYVYPMGQSERTNLYKGNLD
jgi:hypothetical protein